MSFLAPLFLAGAAAVALPLIFHLIRRSAKEKIFFSSLMFLDPSPPRITKRSRLEHLFLLLLRCAVVCLLAFAFARPFLSRPLAAPSRAEQSLSVAILVDTSASMRREDLWPRARKQAIQAARNLGPGSRVGLFTFDQQLRTTLSFSDSSRMTPTEISAAIESRLSAMEPGWGSTHLGNALTGAAEQLADELNRESREFGRARIILISDLQSGAKLDGLQGFEWPKNTEVHVQNISAANPSNAGIHFLQNEARLSFAATNAPARVRIQNSVGSRNEQFQIAWAKDGQALGESIRAYVPPGERRIVASPPQPGGADQLVLIDDPVDYDNHAFWVPAKSQELIIFYHGNEADNDPSYPLYYVKRAFEQKDLALRVLRLTGTNASANPDAALLIATEPLAGRSLQAAQHLLASGKTVVFAVRHADAVQSLSSLLEIPNLSASEAQVKNYALLGQIDFTHPLFRPFSDARYSDFTKIHFWKHRRLDLAPLTNAIIPARFDSGDPFLIEVPFARSRILIFASSWAPSDSQLALSTKFIPLLFGILEQSAGEQNLPQQYLVGEPVRLPDNLVPPLTIQAPDGKSHELDSRAFQQTLVPGIYRLNNSEFRFAVNLDPAESKINPISADDLQNLGVPMGPATLTPRAQALAASRQQHRLASEAEAQQKLWRNILIGAVAFAFLETFIAGRLSRSLAAA